MDGLKMKISGYLHNFYALPLVKVFIMLCLVAMWTRVYKTSPTPEESISIVEKF